jgi:hypothetical protein
LTTVTNTTIAPDLRVTNLGLNPASPQSSQNVTVNWNDFNAGSGSTGASWTDHVVVTNTTTNQTLATGNVAYNASVNGNIAPNGSAAQSYSFQLPNGPAGAGSLQVTVTTNYGDTLVEYYPGGVGYTNDTTTITAASTLASYPDLQVSGLAYSPNSPQSGKNLTVLWNDSNTGQAATTGNWTDQVSVVNSTTGQTLVTANVPYNVAASGNIAAGGASPQLSYTYQLPDGSAGVGTLQVTVTTNANGQLYEYNSSGTATSNNTATTTATSTLSNYADLTVANIALQSPANPQSGNQVTVGWNDENIGDAAVSSAFNDYVLVQKVNSGNSYTTIASGNVSGNATLAAGGTSPRTFGFTLPDGAAGVGNFLITVTTDSGETVKEYTGTGNTAFGNNTSTANFTTTLANYADLTVANIAVQSPASPQSGNQVTVGWNDDNIGDGAVNSAFSDSVLVQKVNSGNSYTTIASGNVSGNATLAAGGLSPQTFSFTLPIGTAGTGNFLITVTTDSGQTVKEYDSNGNTAFGNNTGTLNFTSTIANYPDLQVSGLAVATVNPQSGKNVTIVWNDANTGLAATAGNWTDSITIVNSTTGSTLVSANVPYSAATSGNIAAGGTSPQLSYTYQLPDGSAGVGTLQVTVTTNANGQLYEYNSSGTATSNNTATTTATSTLSNYADLTVANIAVQSPASPQSGNQVTVGWNDDNIGDGAVSSAFTDSVLVQKVNSGNSYTTIASSNVSGNATLAAGGTSPETYSFTLPDGAAGVGNFLITVTTDSGQTVKEYTSTGNTAYGNNTSTGNFTTTLGNYADLMVANIAVQSPASPQSGNQVTVGWNDDNIGDGAVNSAFNDSVLVQKVNSSNSYTTIASGNVSGNAALAAGGTSPRTFAFTLPDGAAGAGTFLVTVTTDSGETVKEYDSNGNTAFGNNTTTANFSAAVANYADLTVANIAVQSPASPQSGNQVIVGWNDDNCAEPNCDCSCNQINAVCRCKATERDDLVCDQPRRRLSSPSLEPN